jgi:MinD-like ATPase involved in chromosome partitioning or flagellar assembly
MVPTVREGGDEGRPVVIGKPTSEIAQAFRSMARAVVEKVLITAAQSPSDPTQSIQVGKFN